MSVHEMLPNKSPEPTAIIAAGWPGRFQEFVCHKFAVVQLRTLGGSTTDAGIIATHPCLSTIQ